MTTKAYANDDIAVIWKPELCIHSAKCVEGLPKVFDPERKPWIDPKAATTDEIKAQVGKCPSGALSWQAKGAEKNWAEANWAEAMGAEAKGTLPRAITPAGTDSVTVEATRNGPLIVRGAHALTGSDGLTAAKSGAVAYCRCGQSGKKPFCDGTHTKVGFKG